MSFKLIKGHHINPSEVEHFITQYYNGGQTIVTYVSMKSGLKFELNDINSMEFQRMLEED